MAGRRQSVKFRKHRGAPGGRNHAVRDRVPGSEMRSKETAMRVTLPILAATALLAAGCANGTHEIAAAPPSVSYQVAGNNVSQANARAVRYCQQYGLAAQLQGVQPSGSGNVATYTCTSS